MARQSEESTSESDSDDQRKPQMMDKSRSVVHSDDGLSDGKGIFLLLKCLFNALNVFSEHHVIPNAFISLVY